MKRAEWRKELGELVRDAMRSPELDHYFRVKITKPGAQVLITQLGLFIHHRRDCWSHVSGNCPHMSVKQKILQHEYGEVIKDGDGRMPSAEPPLTPPRRPCLRA